MIKIYPDEYNGVELKHPTNSFRWKYSYLHGELETISGYDCFNIIGNSFS